MTGGSGQSPESQIIFRLTGYLKFCLLLKMQILFRRAEIYKNLQIPIEVSDWNLAGQNGGSG